MRELDCDFCGATAAGAYEILPAELDPSPGEQVRVVLCDDCRTTLDGVLDPLLARLDAGGATGAADGGTTGAAPDPGPGPDSGRGTAGTPPATSEESDAPIPEDDPESEGDAQANARSGNPSLPADDAVILDASGGSDGTAAADDAGTGDAEPDDAADDGSDGAGGSDGEPERFRRVMRLLGDREFPLDRAEVVDIAGSAYDLDREETDRIVDYAVEKDVLEEEDGRLHKT